MQKYRPTEQLISEVKASLEEALNNFSTYEKQLHESLVNLKADCNKETLKDIYTTYGSAESYLSVALNALEKLLNYKKSYINARKSEAKYLAQQQDIYFTWESLFIKK
jgi:hypothetical protein